MSKYIVSFIDPGPRHVKLRTSREFGSLKQALSFFNHKPKESEPKMEQEIIITEEVDAKEVSFAFEQGVKDAKNNKPKANASDLYGPYNWAYDNGYHSIKYG